MDDATLEAKLKEMIVDRLFLKVPADQIEADGYERFTTAGVAG